MISDLRDFTWKGKLKYVFAYNSQTDVSIFTVPGVELRPEERKFPPAVLRAAQALKNKAKF